MVIIITGAHKALALQKTIECGVNHMWTLSSLQMHPHAMIVVDEDATLELQVKTVKVRKPSSLNQYGFGTNIRQIVLQVYRASSSFPRFRPSPAIRRAHPQETRFRSRETRQPSKSNIEELSSSTETGSAPTAYARAGTGFDAISTARWPDNGCCHTGALDIQGCACASYA